MASTEIQSRKEAAERIQSAPRRYKVCECCGSIVTRRVMVCPNCNAYRFDAEAATVIRQAQILASREPLSIEAHDYE
jgi:recombinational DNA repair protein RecR